MLKMSHSNVVRLIGVAIQQRPWLCVLEFMEYGDLRGCILSCKEKSIQLELGTLQSASLLLTPPSLLSLHSASWPFII